MSLGSITNLLSDVPRPTDLGAGQILLQSRGPGELFFGRPWLESAQHILPVRNTGRCKRPYDRLPASHDATMISHIPP
jgi:hypothetical protein